MRRRESLLASLIVLGAGTAYTVQAESGISRVMGSINIAAGEHTGDLSTVNGSIHIGENAVVGAAHSVNGSISLERRASAAELKTVNGSVSRSRVSRDRDYRSKHCASTSRAARPAARSRQLTTARRKPPGGIGCVAAGRSG
jgi:hypothetical protein